MMDKQEAISVLRSNYPTSNYTLLREAVDMAMKSLSNEKEESFRQYHVCNPFINLIVTIPSTFLEGGEEEEIVSSYAAGIAQERYRLHDEYMRNLQVTHLCEFTEKSALNVKLLPNPNFGISLAWEDEPDDPTDNVSGNWFDISENSKPPLTIQEAKYKTYNKDEGKYQCIASNNLVEAIHIAWNYEYDVYTADTEQLIFSAYEDNDTNSELLLSYGLRLIDDENSEYRVLQDIQTNEIFLPDYLKEKQEKA